MSRFIGQKNVDRLSRPWVVTAILAIVLVGAVWALRTWYSDNLRPVSMSSSTSYFAVDTGSGVHEIATELEQAKLIRSSRAFETYVRSNEYNDRLQAGTYVLSPSMSTQHIVRKMVVGDVARNLLTILPAKRLDQVKEAFKRSGYSDAEIEQAFNPATYSGHPALASLPAGASLEGYLYPDSFQRQAETPAANIIRQSLDIMSKHLNAEITAGFAARGLSIHQGVTLASIVLAESDNASYQPSVSQVFLSRLKLNMPLGSDVTAFYASDVAKKPRTLDIDSVYNTRIHSGLPPGPIGNVTKSALRAVANPASTDYLYFVAGDDHKVHFTHTQAEHEQAIRQYCTKLCG